MRKSLKRRPAIALASVAIGLFFYYGWYPDPGDPFEDKATELWLIKGC